MPVFDVLCQIASVSVALPTDISMNGGAAISRFIDTNALETDIYETYANSASRSTSRGSSATYYGYRFPYIDQKYEYSFDRQSDQHHLARLRDISKGTSIPPDWKRRHASLMLNEINEARSYNGLRTLSLDPKLSRVVNLRASDMQARKYYGHFIPGSANGKPGYHIGENLTADANFTASVPLEDEISLVHQAFMLSKGHSVNVLNPKFTKVRLGMAVDRKGNVNYVQRSTLGRAEDL